MPPLNIESEHRALHRALSETTEQGSVEIKILAGSEATLENLQEALRSFRPQILHFVGHGLFVAEQERGGIMLSGADGKADPLPSTRLGSSLMESDLLLAVLNGCETGIASSKDVLTGAAGELIRSGVPAVVATLRTVTDEAAVIFTREFYRTLGGGEPLEVAMVEGRRALSGEGWDWSAYVLLTSVRDLSWLRVGSRLRQSAL